MIVIPMAGLSSRFFKAGFTQPKYMLPLHQETVFDWAIRSFEAYFSTDEFLFIVRDLYDTAKFVEQHAQQLGIKNYKIHILDQATQGQADTVYLAVKNLPEQPLYIFNIDSKIFNFKKALESDSVDGYLEVFEGEGEHWSFVRPGVNNTVLETTEKVRISNLCSNGLYYFKSSKIFVDYFLKFKQMNDDQELYIAPIYNLYIQDKKNIKYVITLLENIAFCGVPDEYHQVAQQGEVI